MSAPVRLTVVMTHPVQYAAPWFRHIARACPEIDLTVLYATSPTPEQQGTGFGRALAWDVPLLEGYPARVVRAARPGDDVGSDRFRGVDVPEIVEAISESRPDVALVPGWHSATLVRALIACHRMGVPALYRGDSHLGTAPRGWRRPAWLLRTRWLLGRFAAYLAVGNRAETYLRALGADAARIVPSPHAVDNEFFARAAAPHRTPERRAAARAAFGIEPDDFVVAFVGKLEAKKCPLDLVRAIARLRPGTRLFVVGSGALESPMREAVARLGVRASWAGFVNQSELGRTYAAADCLALPSDWGETWGLVVNEALATGLPAVVSDRVGSAPDLVLPGVTGEVFAWSDVAALSGALARVRDRTCAGHDWAPACRARVDRHSLARAADGLVEACLRVTERGDAVTRMAANAALARRQAGNPELNARPSPAGSDQQNGAVGRDLSFAHDSPRRLADAPRVLACCGDMVVVSGRERLTFEVLRALGERGAAVRCIVNRWENHRIVPMVDAIHADWATGHYATAFDRHARSPRRWAAQAWDVLMTSAGLLAEARRFRATHVLVPSVDTAIRNAPALLLLRALGRPVVLRVANHPGPGRFHRALWGRVLPPLVTRFAPNSVFAAERLRAAGVPDDKIATIRNTVAHRGADRDGDRLAESPAELVGWMRRRPTVLVVGQIAPFKGTHLAVEAMLALLDAGLDVRAAIVGRAPEWPPALARYAGDLRRRVAEAGAADRVRFVGERDDVLDLMRAAAVLAAPILQEETFGNVVLEARSVGLPVVAFSTGGVLELVEHGVTGYLCAEPTRDALIAGLRHFLDDPARRARASAASAAASEADADTRPDVFAERWWRLMTSTEA